MRGTGMSTKAIAALVAVMMAASAAFILTADGAYAEEFVTEDGDTVEFYTFSPTFHTINTGDKNPVTDWRWDFGDGTILDSRDERSEDAEVRDAYLFLLMEHGGSINDPRHTYESEGTYNASVTGYNTGEEGQEQSTTINFTVIIHGHPTVTFIVDGEEYAQVEVPKGTSTEPYEPVSISECASAEMPEDPVVDGYELRGWYIDQNHTQRFDENVAVGKDITVYAWMVPVGTEIFTVEFVNVSMGPIEIASGDVLERPEDPVRDGWIFGGWYTDQAFEHEYVFGQAVTSDLKLYAKWTADESNPPVTHTVSFSGAEMTPLTVNDGEAAEKPGNPFKIGFRFDGWFVDAECTQAYDWESPVTGDITLYAKWTQLTVDTEGNGDGISIVSIIIGVFGLLLLLVGWRGGNSAVALIGFIVLIVGCLAIYADSTGSDLLTWLQDLIGGGENDE